jgi:type IV pilus assembly protein PilM
MIQTIFSDAKIKTRQCAFSIPDFSTFFTNFSLPPMTEKELGGAVMFEARQHIPLPMESVTVDWQLAAGDFDKSKKLEITVAAIPNEIITRYRQIAAKAQLQVVLMEAEMFGLVRALIGPEEMQPVCLIDIGAQSTVCSLVEKRILRYSHSFDRGGNYLINEFIRRLPIERETAQNIGRDHGLRLLSLIEPEIREKTKGLLRESLLPIFREIEMMLNDYNRLTGSGAAKIILSGGAASIKEIKDQFSDYFKKEIKIADPFKEFGYSAGIEACLEEIGPSYAVAAGMALRGFEFLKHTKPK